MLGSRIELLLVDDDESDRELVFRLLSIEYVVNEAATADEAWECPPVRKRNPQIAQMIQIEEVLSADYADFAD